MQKGTKTPKKSAEKPVVTNWRMYKKQRVMIDKIKARMERNTGKAVSKAEANRYAIEKAYQVLFVPQS